MTFRLTKHHGLGNDFLVHLTDDGAALLDESWPECAQAWCDRTHGVGADGLLIGVRDQPGADLFMLLFNADGSRAEMSGNGIRCLAQAEARRRGQTEGKLDILTDGGPRAVTFGPALDGDPLAFQASVDMGPAGPGPAPARELPPLEHDTDDHRRLLGLDATEVATFDLGNPHLVLLVAEPHEVDVATAGDRFERRYDGGMNVHFVAPTPGEADAMTMAIWERGVGPTEACGTGATAVARAAYDWGLVGDRVTVHMPGGDVVVEVGETMVLHGPSVYIAAVEVPG